MKLAFKLAGVGHLSPYPRPWSMPGREICVAGPLGVTVLNIIGSYQ